MSDSAMISADERRALLALARTAVEARVRRQPPPEAHAREGPAGQPGAAFVSVHVGPHLRGCLGCIEPRHPNLASVIVDMAAAAASEDPRFAPLAEEELADTTIEISVLGPLVAIAGPGDVTVGRDGLVIDSGARRGLLLPQVARDWGWDAERFVAETCRKAGLPSTAWREGARLYRFEAEVFAEPDASAPGLPESLPPRRSARG